MRFPIWLIACLLTFEVALPAQDRQAWVKVPLAPVTAERQASSEQVTQVLLGDRVLLVGAPVQGWQQVLVPDQYRTPQGYPGWMRAEALWLQASWQGAAEVTVAYPKIALRTAPEVGAPVALEVYMGTRLQVEEALPSGAPASQRSLQGEPWYRVRVPSGERLWVRASQVAQESEPALAEGSRLIAQGRRWEGTNYLWGGMSQQGIDCSGLVYILYRLNGITLPRDADQQFEVGEAIEPEQLRPGDMVFFGEPGDITHVGLYADQGLFLHASSGSGVVVSPLFEGWYEQRYQGARRVLAEGAPGRRVVTP